MHRRLAERGREKRPVGLLHLAWRLAVVAAAALVGLFVVPPGNAAAAFERLAPTPPMGWNPWYLHECDVNESMVRRTADAMVRTGMKALGYSYVNLDDCWMGSTRNASGALYADPTRFPHGIKALADYVHKRGLRLGIYLDAGTETCDGFPGSEGHFEQDAATIGGWGVDYLKLDWCNTRNPPPEPVYAAMRAALAETGRPIVLSVCEWGLDAPWTWASRAGGQLWRTAGDYTWYGAPQDWWGAVRQEASAAISVDSYAHAGAWNDPDLLLVGTGLLNDSEGRAQFSAWSMLAAPLLADNDLFTMSRSALSVLTNREVIEVDQDAAALPARIVTSYPDGTQVWLRRLANGDHALLVLNPSSAGFKRRINLRRIGLRAKSYEVRDLWTHRWRPRGRTVRVEVPPAGAEMFRLVVACRSRPR